MSAKNGGKAAVVPPVAPATRRPGRSCPRLGGGRGPGTTAALVGFDPMRLAFRSILLGLILGTAHPGFGQAPLPPPRPPAIEREKPASAPITGRFPAGSDANGESRWADSQACLARLAKLGITAEPVPAIGNGSCGAQNPLRLAQLPNWLEVSPPAIVTCPVAEALAKWVLEAVSAEAERHLSSSPTKILIGTSYECRSRNRQAGGKLSEHAFANAVDVMGFAFPKRPAISVASRDDETPEAMFLGAVRAKACTYFTTVLGPGADAAHTDHLHLDLRERKRGAKLCQ
jgi:hypothetical protein